MADTKLYRNDSKEVYDIPGLGLIGPGQRVASTGQFAPQIVLENYPGLVDVLEEEAEGKKHDYTKNPEPEFDEVAHREKVAKENEAADAAAAAEASAPAEQITQTPAAPEQPAQGEQLNG